MLASALNSLPGLRSPARLSDEDYVTLGRRSNTAEMAAGDTEGFIELLRDGESLDDLLDVPFALARAHDLHAAMQLAVASVGDVRDDLTGHVLFYPVFTGFVLGFSIGLTSGHRAKLDDPDARVNRLPKRSQELCEAWGVAIAVFYLARVEAGGIVDRETDQHAYGIQSQWRLVADERRLDAFDQLPEVVRAGRAAGEQWLHDESVEIGGLLLEVLENFVSIYPDRTFH